MNENTKLREWAREHATPSFKVEDLMVAGESLVRRCTEIARREIGATRHEIADAILREFGLEDE